MRRTPFALLAVPWTASFAFAGGVAIFHGPPGGIGDVLVHDEAGGASIPVHELSRIRLASLDFCGRTALHELSPARPRFHDDVPFVARIALQGHGGSLYAFERPGPSGPTAWGFFHVANDGSARVVIERPALPWGTNPFFDRVGVAPDGRALLVATLAEAGGDLFEIDLATGAVRDRTELLPPLHFALGSLLLEDDWGCGVASEGIFRFERSTVCDAEPVGFPSGATPAWFQRQVVASENGLFAATVAGDSPIAEFVWVFGRFGGAQQASLTPDRIAPAGFEPEVRSGPWLAVSDDGARVAWRSEVSTSGYGAELFLAERTPLGVALAEHVTRDELFDPYIDEIGQFSFGPGGRLSFLAGDASSSSGSGLFRCDAFAAELLPGGLDARNLTASSGQPLPPFTLYGLLAPERALKLPASDSTLLFDRQAESGELLRVNAASGSTTVLEDLFDFEPIGTDSNEIVFAALDDDDFDEFQIHGLPATAWGQSDELAELHGSYATLRSALGTAGSLAVISEHPSGNFLWRADLASGDEERMSSRSFEFGPALAFTSQQSIVFSIGAAGSPSLFCVWPHTGPARRLANERFVGALLPAE